MTATTTPSDMTPEERRAEVAAILAAGYLRLARRPRPYLAPREYTGGARAGGARGRAAPGVFTGG